MGIIEYIVIAIFAAVILGVSIYMIVKLAKMSADDKKKYLVTYLKGAVALAEKEIGSGNGQEKLALVEAYFKKQAPLITKLVLAAVGKNNLRDLIELALAEVKEAFCK